MMNPVTMLERTPRHYPITRGVYHTMADQGIIGPDDRVELIDGEIFEMSPIGRLHARCVNWLTETLIQALAGKFIVSIQNPVVLDDTSEPQPDIVILRRKDDFYGSATPGVEDTLVVIEVADTSVNFDRSKKLRKYAESGIQESWLIDLQAERVEVHSQPAAGGYGLVRAVGRGERAVSVTIPAIDISVDELLG